MQLANKLILIAGLTLSFFGANATFSSDETDKQIATKAEGAKTNNFVQPKTLAELLALPPQQLDKVDIARIDLLCAEGLPGAENLNLEKCIETLDDWARDVKVETERNYHRFAEHPEKFKNSLGRYRMAVMAAVFSQNLRVQYNPQREKELVENQFFGHGEPYGEAERSFTSDSGDLFLHGLLSDKRYGTCASMPYLFVAIGRRLGYPVSIAGAHMHCYVYYDEGDGKHFNVEATEHRGFVTPADDEYKNPSWGAPSSPEYYETRGLLRPMGNKESMAHILAERAAVFRSAGRHDEEAKTWATAARYFPDTPTWKEIADNMQQCAKLDEYHQWRDGIWKELAAYVVPRGPGFAYFLDKKIKLRLFMNESFDREAIQKAADEFRKELSEYSKMAMRPIDDGKTPEQPVPELRQLHFYYRLPDGNEVKVPADFMPPFARGELPMELQQHIVAAKPQDADTLLEMVWDYYAQMQAMNLAKQKAEVERIASGNPVLISEESIPPEFRQGVPMDLAIRLSGLHNARDIVVEMLQYKHQQEVQRQEMSANPMAVVATALRRAGVPDSVTRMSGLPVSGLSGIPSLPGVPGADYRSRGMPNMQALTAQGMMPDPFEGQTDLDRRIQRGNEQAMQMVEQYFRPQNAMRPGMALPYQVVPASVAANNPAVENPMPLGGFPNSPLTPLPQPLITAPATKNDEP